MPDRPIDPETGNPMSVRDIAQYGATIQRVAAQPGTKYWQIVDAYHLPGQQNKGNHNIFVDMLNADGTRRNGAHVTLYAGDKQFTNTLDKPANEPGTNFPTYRGPRYDVAGADMPSDRAVGFSTDYPDEEAGNTNGHHSYMVVFKEAIAGGVQNGGVRGSITNGAGRNVTLTGTNVNLTATAGADGSFTFDNVPPGTYNLAVVGTNVASSVVVNAGQNANITLTVPPINDPGNLQQQLNQAIAERDKYKNALTQIKQIIQGAGL